MRAVVSFALALLAATPASAQLTEKEAIKQLKSASKAQLKAFKQSAAAALSTMDATLSVIEDQFSPSSAVLTVGPQILGIAADYLATLNEAFSDAKGNVDSSAILTLQALEEGGSLEGHYPEDFSYGTGGTLDKHRASLVKAGIKSRDAAAKRVAKSVARAEKDAGIAVTFELRFPTRSVAFAVDAGGGIVPDQAATIDVIGAASELGVDDDGVLLFGGETDDSSDVTAEYFTTGIAESDDVSPSPGTDRFLAIFIGLHEGGYMVSVEQGTSSAFHSVGEIGLR